MSGIFRETFIFIIVRVWHLSVINKVGQTVRHQPPGLDVGRVDLGFVLLAEKSGQGHAGQYTNDDHGNQQLHQGEAPCRQRVLAVLPAQRRGWQVPLGTGVLAARDGDGGRCGCGAWRTPAWPDNSGLPGQP